jgi:hypothetical protein
MNKERMGTLLIIIGLFDGLINRTDLLPVCRLSCFSQKRLWLFIVAEFIGFACMGLIVYYARSRKK